MTRSQRASSFLALGAMAIGLGLAEALVTVGIVELLEATHDIVWGSLPTALGTDPFSVVYVLPVCALGGVLVGLARRTLGEHPEPLEEALERFAPIAASTAGTSPMRSSSRCSLSASAPHWGPRPRSLPWSAGSAR
jgi:hypothetical protein